MSESYGNKEGNRDSKDSGGGGNDGAIDASSFASILAGVQRMRNQYNETTNDDNIKDITVVETKSSKNATTSGLVLKSNEDASSKTNQDEVSPRYGGSSIPNKTDVNVSSASKPTTSRPPRMEESSVSSAQSLRNAVRSGNITRTAATQDILVNKSQTGNPLLKDSIMKITPWKFDTTILSDYYISSTFQIIFLSLKYHKLRPEYIWQRLKKLNKGSSIDTNNQSSRILLTVVDIDSHQEILRKLLDFCIKHDLTLVLSWSFEEAGNYICLAKQLYNTPMKSMQSIRGTKATDYNSLITDSLTQIRSINKTDVSNLLANYKSLKNIVQQSCNLDSNLLEISGLGSTKLNHMKRVFSEPFIYNKKYKKE